MDYLLEGEETNRLLFRKLYRTDFDTWLPFHQNPLTSQYWSSEHPDPETACQQWFDKIFYRYDKKLGGMNVLIDKKTGELIGQCGLLVQTVDHMEELEIGYSIMPHYWNKGYATEAAKKCKEHAFKNDMAQSLISIIHIAQMASQKVAINNGMFMEKTTTYKDNPVHIFRVYGQ